MDTLFGVKFFSGSAKEAIEVLRKRLNSTKPGEPLLVFTPNTEQLMHARRNPDFFAALQQSDMNLPDTVGVVWAGKTLGIKPFAPRRIAGREMVSSLLPHLKSDNKKVMLIGGKSDTAQRAADRLRAQYPGLEVESDPGAADARNETLAEAVATLEKVALFSPDLLLIAYGAPQQELWALKHKEELGKRGVKVVMVVGGVLDLLAGNLLMPPALVVALGLEWLWRLIQQPSRLGRQLVLPLFALMVLRKKLFRNS